MIPMVMISLLGVTLVFWLRGGEFHNFLVGEAEAICRRAGLKTAREYPLPLPGGGVNFVDLAVWREGCLLCVEVETTARNVLSNVRKARLLGCPLLLLVPSRQMARAVGRKLESQWSPPEMTGIYILLLAQLEKEVTNCFPLIFPANGKGEKGKSIQTNQTNPNNPFNNPNNSNERW